jgi:hypothetical protein
MMSNKRTNPDSAGDAVGKKKGRHLKSKYNLSDAVNLVSLFRKKCSMFPCLTAIFLERHVLLKIQFIVLY